MQKRQKRNNEYLFILRFQSNCIVGFCIFEKCCHIIKENTFITIIIKTKQYKTFLGGIVNIRMQGKVDMEAHENRRVTNKMLTSLYLLQYLEVLESERKYMCC